VQLITSYGTWNDVAGTVVRCRYLDGNVHEVVVQFDEEINPAVYCSDAVGSRVLLVDDDPSISRLTQFQLRQLNAHVDHVTGGEEALEKVNKESYDIVLMDMEMPGLSGFEAVKELRKRGYSGTVVATTGLTAAGDAERCVAAGCDKYLPKPYTRNDLSALLESLRQEPLFSTFHDHPEMKALVRTFVGELPLRLRALEEAVIKQDTAKLQYLCRCLKSEGTGYGFDVISETAARVESALLAGQTLSLLHKDVNTLVKLCMQARAAVRSGDSAEAPSAESALDAALPPKEPPAQEPPHPA
jgi:CheY-like chemotaxis protein